MGYEGSHAGQNGASPKVDKGVRLKGHRADLKKSCWNLDSLPPPTRCSHHSHQPISLAGQLSRILSTNNCKMLLIHGP